MRRHAADDAPFELRAVCAHGSDVARLRSTDQRVSGPESAAAVAAARRVFDALDFTGVTLGEVRRLLGGPAESGSADGVTFASYRWHDGEQGVGQRFEFEGHRVARMVALPVRE